VHLPQPLGAFGWIALALVLAAAATLVHWLFWRWRLGLSGQEPERHEALTGDGWRLALGRHPPARQGPGGVAGPSFQPPVLLLHGIAQNRLALDFPVAGHSLAAHLAAAGLDAWALDLRGHGDSRPTAGAPRRWSLDDYLTQDVPAALDAIRATTGQPSAFLVGHSQGALLALVAAGLYPERVAGVVALAPPIRFLPGLPLLAAIPWLQRLRIGRLASQLLAPYAGLVHPRLAGEVIRAEEMERPVFRRLMMNGVESLPPGVVAHFARLAREDRLGSLDGRVDWRAGLARCHQPALFVAAPADGLVPLAVVAEAHALWGGEKARWQAPEGVGHADLILGRRAPELLFPVVRDWLLAHAREVAR